MNPHPTRSKPYKIGRKHTGARGVRAKGKLQSKAIKANSKKVSVLRKFKEKVSSFWKGEIDQYPKPI